MFFSRLLLNTNIYIFSLLCCLGLVFSSTGLVNAVENPSSGTPSVMTEQEKSTSLFSTEKTTTAMESMAKPSVGEPVLQESANQEQTTSKDPEKKTLLLRSMHQTNQETNTPVTVSTMNSTISVLKKAQQRAVFFSPTNSTLLPGLNATVPVSLPPSNMPQLTPVTNW